MPQRNQRRFPAQLLVSNLCNLIQGRPTRCQPWIVIKTLPRVDISKGIYWPKKVLQQHFKVIISSIGDYKGPLLHNALRVGLASLLLGSGLVGPGLFESHTLGHVRSTWDSTWTWHFCLGTSGQGVETLGWRRQQDVAIKVALGNVGKGDGNVKSLSEGERREVSTF